ncbi:MAG: hypothetical protein JXA93_04580, partial [Anaerolineae bacterium]|nr:hypothetical protein [Anaerolineae bacterium]
MEVWQKVFLDQEAYFETIHGRYGCIACHGGVGGAAEKEAAHEDLVRDPASAKACGGCHPTQVAAEEQSLHSNLTGYTTVLAARSEPSKMPQLEVMMNNHCDSCHTSCGQCHVSRPTSTGGGLV